MPKKAPIRTCVGCRRARPQPELVRFHLDAHDHLCQRRNGAGRGAWLCAEASSGCFQAAVERKAFTRALRRAPAPESLNFIGQQWPTDPQE